jgi:hypothetical protein
MRIFYRVVSEAELADIARSGRLRHGPNSVEGKHLVGDVGSAKKMARLLYPDGGYRIIEVVVADELSRRFFAFADLDRCGPAWFAEIDDLVDAVVREVTI